MQNREANFLTHRSLLFPREVSRSCAAYRQHQLRLGATFHASPCPQGRVAGRKPKAAVTPAHVKRLEDAIDAREESLPPLKAFILPGGSPAAALLHFSRTVCRRAERRVVALARHDDVDPQVVTYLNRLSDLLFVLARDANRTSGVTEETW